MAKTLDELDEWARLLRKENHPLADTMEDIADGWRADKNDDTLPLDTLVKLITQWAIDRGIHDHSSANAQLLKAVSEMGEIADAEIKGDAAGQIDGVGDVVVCLINYAAMNGFTLAEAVAAAYTEIKDRKGRMVEGGAFVKDEE